MGKQAANTRQRGPDGKFLSRNTEGPRWAPGESGNPKGRPLSLTTALKRLLADNPERLNEIAEALLTSCAAGDHRPLALLWDRLDGRVVDARPDGGEDVVQLLPPGRIRQPADADAGELDG